MNILLLTSLFSALDVLNHRLTRRISPISAGCWEAECVWHENATVDKLRVALALAVHAWPGA